MCLTRKTITGSTSLTINNNFTILDTSCYDTLQSGIATFEGCALCYFIARRQLMIVQIL